jgi:hypothetical protein
MVGHVFVADIFLTTRADGCFAPTGFHVFQKEAEGDLLLTKLALPRAHLAVVVLHLFLQGFKTTFIFTSNLKRRQKILSILP